MKNVNAKHRLAYSILVNGIFTRKSKSKSIENPSLSIAPQFSVLNDISHIYLKRSVFVCSTIFTLRRKIALTYWIIYKCFFFNWRIKINWNCIFCTQKICKKGQSKSVGCLFQVLWMIFLASLQYRTFAQFMRRRIDNLKEQNEITRRTGDILPCHIH